jgi:uncharacterized protein (DUF169 family)
MNSYSKLAVELQSLLRLRKPPIAISFKPDASRGLVKNQHVVPSSCTFWAMALTDEFYTTREQHLNCSIGALTHGYKLPGEVMPGCGCADVDAMTEAGWITTQEIERLPRIPRHDGVVAYGPLSHDHFEPDVVLIFCNADQAMLIKDAAGHCKLMGKPACSAIPTSYTENSVVISLGCTASRLRAGYGPEELIITIPAGKFPEVVEKLKSVFEADLKVAQFVESSKA